MTLQEVKMVDVDGKQVLEKPFTAFLKGVKVLVCHVDANQSPPVANYRQVKRGRPKFFDAPLTDITLS